MDDVTVDNKYISWINIGRFRVSDVHCIDDEATKIYNFLKIYISSREQLFMRKIYS